MAVKLFQYALDDAQLMGVFAEVGAENAVGVQSVDLHVAGGVQNLVVAANNAHVDDVALLVLEESEVSNTGFVHKINGIAVFHLIGCIAGQAYADAVVHILHKSGAVDSRRSASAPQIRGVEIVEGAV